MLINEGCLDEGTTPAEAESYLTRQVKAGDALEAHLALQAWADKTKMPPPPARRPRHTNTTNGDLRPKNGGQTKDPEKPAAKKESA